VELEYSPPNQAYFENKIWNALHAIGMLSLWGTITHRFSRCIILLSFGCF